MKPLYIWAGGKRKLITQYLKNPGIPTTGFDTFVEPFFGGGAMMIWVSENCPDVKHYVNVLIGWLEWSDLSKVKLTKYAHTIGMSLDR